MNIFKPSSSLFKASLLLLVFIVSAQSASASGVYQVTRGSSLTLTWAVTGASNCTPGTTYPTTADGWNAFWIGTNPQPASGTKTLPFYAAPNQDYTFTCTASGVSDTTTVHINDCGTGTHWDGSTSCVPNTYIITPASGSGGTVSPLGAQSVNYGSNITFNITPNTGYSISSVTVDGTNVGTPTTYTFNNVTSDHTISAAFSINTFTITPSAGSGGSISPSNPQTVNYGSNQTFNITPNINYAIQSVTVDGSNVGTPTSYVFNNVTANHTISAAFVFIANSCNQKVDGTCTLPGGTQSGTSAGSCTPPYSGTCSALCTNGVWGSTTNNCTPPPAPVVTVTSHTVYGGATGQAYYGENSVGDGGQIYISWTATNNPDSCTVYRDGASQGTQTSPYLISSGIVATTNFVVKCTNVGGTGTSNTATFTVPPVPSNPTGSCQAPGSPLTLSWSTAAPNVYVRIAKGAVDPNTAACGTPQLNPPEGLCGGRIANTNSYTFTPSTPGAQYSWYVYGADQFGNWSQVIGTNTTNCAAAPTATFTNPSLTCTVPAGSNHCNPVPTINWTTANTSGETFTDCAAGVYSAFNVPPNNPSYNGETVTLSGSGPTANGCYRIYYGKYYDNPSLQAAINAGTSWVISTADQIVTASCASGSTWGVASQTCLADPAIGSFTSSLYGLEERGTKVASDTGILRSIANKVMGVGVAYAAALANGDVKKINGDLAYAYGSKVQLTWGAVTGGGTITCNITNDKDGTSLPAAPLSGGSVIVGPLTQSTTFTLTCSNGVGPAATKTTFVSIDPANCPATTINNCDVNVTVAGNTSGTCHSGYYNSCQYTCKSDGTWNVAGGTNTCAADTVTLKADGNAGSETVLNGSTVHLTWASQGAVGCWSSGGSQGVDGPGFVSGGVANKGAPGVSVVANEPPNPASYGIDCYDSKGFKFSSVVSVTLIDPTLTITANPTRVPVGGGATTIAWTANDIGASGCSITKNGASWKTNLLPDGSGNVSGSQNDPSVTTQTTYKLTCTSITGKVYSQSTVVNVGSNFQNF